MFSPEGCLTPALHRRCPPVEFPTPGSSCGPTDLWVREGAAACCAAEGCLGALSPRNTLRVADNGDGPPWLLLFAQGVWRTGDTFREGWCSARGFHSVPTDGGAEWSVQVGTLLRSMTPGTPGDGSGCVPAAEVRRLFRELHVHIECSRTKQRSHFHVQTSAPPVARSGRTTFVFGKSLVYNETRGAPPMTFSSFRMPQTEREEDILRSPLVRRAITQIIQESASPAARALCDEFLSI